MFKLNIPRDLLTWIDEKRGTDCRAVFIIKQLYNCKYEKEYDAKRTDKTVLPNLP